MRAVFSAMIEIDQEVHYNVIYYCRTLQGT